MTVAVDNWIAAPGELLPQTVYAVTLSGTATAAILYDYTGTTGQGTTVTTDGQGRVSLWLPAGSYTLTAQGHPSTDPLAVVTIVLPQQSGPQAGAFVSYVAAATGVAATDTAAVQAALTAGGSVVLNPSGGAYAINATLTASKAGTVMWAQGAALRPTAALGRSTDILAVPAADVWLHDLWIDGTNGGGTGVHVTGARCRIDAANIIEVGQHGIFLDGGGVSWVKGCRIQNNAVGASGHGILIGSAADIQIANNDVGGYGSGAGIACSGAADVAITGNHFYTNQIGINLYLPYQIRVVGNEVAASQQHGIQVNADTAGTWGVTTISGNVIYHNSSSSSGTYSGIAVIGSVNMPGLVINGNVSSDDQGTPTQAYGVTVTNTTTTRCVVDANVLAPNKTGGINVQAGATVTQGTNVTT